MGRGAYRTSSFWAEAPWIGKAEANRKSRREKMVMRMRKGRQVIRSMHPVAKFRANVGTNPAQGRSFVPMRCSLSSAFFAGFLFIASSVQAQSIADARNAALGSQVTVSGIVTSGPSLGGIRYVQDATAGIAAFPGSGSAPGFNPQPGDAITLSGTLVEYSGPLEHHAHQ